MESALLFVRRTGDVPRAREAANMLLACRRRTRPSTGGEVLGICVGERLDGELVAPRGERPHARSLGVALRESVALAGVWSLCWFELPHLVSLSGADRRRTLLDALELDEDRDPGNPDKRCLFLAVWTPAEARHDVRGGLRGLVGRYPALEIGSEGFVDWPERGVVSLAAASARDNAR